MKWVSDVLEICSGVRYQYSIICVIFCSYSYAGSVVICNTYCTGSEDELTDCDLSGCGSCYNGVVGITCSE